MGREKGLTRRYPPLLVVVAALLLTVFLLPSALNLPLANPGQSLEYAPVPGNNGQAPPRGNLAALSLGSTSAGPGGGSSGSELLTTPPPAPQDTALPSKYQCVGSPPRQTEDPLAPPCVANYTGNNGGATYQGVSGSEIRVVVYLSCYGGGEDAADASATVPCGTYLDLDKPLPAGSTVSPRMLQALDRYFNQRYQTYGRRVHLYVSYGNYDSSQTAPENQASDSSRQADAASDLQNLHPFADFAFDISWQGRTAPYEQAMARAGVLGFDSDAERSAQLFNGYPNLIWGYSPSLEEQADRFVAYICTKIVPYPVSFTGNVPDMNKQRKIGLLYAGQSASQFPEYDAFGRLVQSGVSQKCGGFAVVHTFQTEKAAATNGSNGSGESGYEASAASDMADFQHQGVTTIVWAQGLEHEHSDAGAKIGYLPEYVYAGDSILEDMVPFRYQNQAASAHSIMVSSVTRWDAAGQDVCGEALREVDSSATTNDLLWACHYYPYIRQLFDAIQVAGPHLTPSSVSQGFRAIPQHSSSDPQTPACFYPSGVYTCVHDVEAAWWDNSGSAPNTGGAGCWRLMKQGARYQTGAWPADDAWLDHNNADPCNGYTLSHYNNPAASP